MLKFKLSYTYRYVAYTPQLLEPTYENCLNMLSHLWELYGWEREESKGKKPLFPMGNKNFIKHYASLISDWMNSIIFTQCL